jgi:hypothetical protein
LFVFKNKEGYEAVESVASKLLRIKTQTEKNHSDKLNEIKAQREG